MEPFLIWFSITDMGAFDAAFEMLPKVLQAIHMRLAAVLSLARIFFGSMLNRFMLVAFASQRAIRKMLIRVTGRTLFHIRLNQWQQGGLLGIQSVACYSRSAQTI